MPEDAPPPSDDSALWATPETRARERAAKREAVLRAAVRLFNAQGFHATSLDEVAAALSVTKPTIYHYFASKDAILLECTLRGLEGLRRAARDAAERGGTAADRLRAMLTAYAKIMMGDYGICVARTQDHQLSPESRVRFRAMKREIDQVLRHVAEEGRADGSLAIEHPKIAISAMSMALNGLNAWFDPAGPFSAEEVARLTVESLMRGAEPRPA